MKVAFLGLGIMGSRMAANLLKNNVDLTVFNRSETPLKELETKGAKIAGSFISAVNDADVVFTMLSAPDAVGEIMLSKGGCLSAMKKNSLWVDCSTVDPEFSRKSGEKAKQNAIRFMDAPVAGTKAPAENGTLTFFVGSDKLSLDEVEPLLLFMGTKVIHVGGTGMGTSLKMLVNAMLAESMIVFSEALLLGEKMGLSKDLLFDTLPNLPVIAPFVKAKAKLIKEKNFDPQFPLEWMLKDLHLISKTALENKRTILMGEFVRSIYLKANEQGFSRKDFSVIYQFLKKEF